MHHPFMPRLHFVRGAGQLLGRGGVLDLLFGVLQLGLERIDLCCLSSDAVLGLPLLLCLFDKRRLCCHVCTVERRVCGVQCTVRFHHLRMRVLKHFQLGGGGGGPSRVSLQCSDLS